jgi:hypothetical protein
MSERIEHVILPILPQCCVFRWRTRCQEKGTVWLIAPDGKKNPGGYMCKAHGEGIVSEYREKLGEEWRLVPILEGRHAHS